MATIVKRQIKLILDDSAYVPAHERFLRAGRAQVEMQNRVDDKMKSSSKTIGQAGREVERAGGAARDAGGRFLKAGTDAESFGRAADTAGTRAAAGARRTADAQEGLVAGFKKLAAAAAAYFGAREAFEVAGGMEQGLADLSAITGIAGHDLELLSNTAREAALQTGQAAVGQVEAMKLLASNVNLTTAELQDMSGQVVTLSVAAGVDLATAANVVAGSLNQWGLSASDTGRIVNVLAAGSKEGAAEVGDLAASLGEAGAGAAAAKVTIEQTVGALEILGQNTVKGSQAGNNLANIFTILRTEGDKLAKHGIHGINLETDGLSVTLKKLQPLLRDAAGLTDVFGRENLNAAQILITNADAVDTMTASITGTNVAQEQAAIQTDTLYGDLKKLRTALEEAALQGFDGMGASAREAVQSLTGLVVALDRNWDKVTAVTKALVLGVVAVKSYQIATGLAAALTGAYSIAMGALALSQLSGAGATGVATAAMYAFNAAVMANPIGLLVGGLALAGTALVLYGSAADRAAARTEAAVGRMVTAYDRVRAAIAKLNEEQAVGLREQTRGTMMALAGQLRENAAAQRVLEAELEAVVNDPRPGVQGQRFGIEARLTSLRQVAAVLITQSRQEMSVFETAAQRVQDLRTPAPTPDVPVPAATPTGEAPKTPAGETATARAARLARELEQRNTLGEVVVATDATKADELSRAALEMRLEMIARERQASEAAADAEEDTYLNRRRRTVEQYQLDLDELAVKRQLVKAEEDAGIAAAQRDRTVAISDAGSGPAANKAAALLAAESEYQLATTQVMLKGQQARARLDTEAAGAQLRLGARAQANLRQQQDDAYAAAQARTEEYHASDAATADAAAMAEYHLAAGLIKSSRDVAEAKQALDAAYAVAETDAERERLARLGLELDKLGDKMKRVGEAVGRGWTDDLIKGLREVADIADRVAGLMASTGAGQGLTDAIGDAAAVIGSAGDLAASIASGDVAGMVKGVISVGQSIGNLVTGFGRRAEEERRNRQALADSTEATRANTQAMIRDSEVVGEGLSQADLDAARGGIGDARGQIRGAREVGWGTQGFSEAQDATARALGIAGDNGVDVQDLERQYQDALRLSDPDQRRAALAQILDMLEARLDGLGEHLGEFGQNIAGAVRRYNEALQYGGETVEAAASRLWHDLDALGLGDVAAPLRGLVPGTPEWTAAVTAVWQQLQANPGLLPEGMSREDVMQLLNLGGGAGGAGTTQAGSVSSITAMQGSELLGYQQEQLRALRAILGEVTRIGAGVLTAPSVPASTVGAVAGAAGGDGHPSHGLSLVVQVDIHDGPSNDEIVRVASEGLGRKLDEARPGGRSGRARR